MNQETPENTVPDVFPLGGSALTFDFGEEISPETNLRVVSLSDALDENPFQGFIESVPAFSSLTVFYDPERVAENPIRHGSCYEVVKAAVLKRLFNMKFTGRKQRKAIEIPVDFSPECAPDLDFVASSNGIATETVIELFTAVEYRVYMLGFLPGFPYMAHVDERIAAPRLETPRKNVPKGSVGIAGRQTGIYPLESPGGWRLIGRTGVEIFLRAPSRPTLFAPGDSVRFVRA